MSTKMDSVIDLTEQMILDQVCVGLAAQGGPAREGNGGCSYHIDTSQDGGPDTCVRCAIGLLLTIKEARAAEEECGNDGSVIALRSKGLLPERLVPHLGLLDRIQGAHDSTVLGINGPERFRSRMETVAETYRLNPAKIALITKWDRVA